MKEPIYEIIEFDNNLKCIKRTDADGQIWFIPMDESNSDYQAYLASLEKPTAKK